MHSTMARIERRWRYEPTVGVAPGAVLWHVLKEENACSAGAVGSFLNTVVNHLVSETEGQTHVSLSHTFVRH